MECLFLAKYSAGNFVNGPIWLCAPKGASIPFAFLRANWKTANSVVGNLPPRTPEARQFLENSLANLETFMTAVWDESFEGSFDPILDALRGKDAQAAKKMRETADMCLLLLFHAAVAGWATAMWTQFRDEEILPAEAAERLRDAVQAVVNDLLDNRVDSYPHINFFGPDGRFLTIVDATDAEDRRRLASAGESSGGGVHKPAPYQSNAAAVTLIAGLGAAVALTTPPHSVRSGLPKGGGEARSDSHAALAPGSRSKKGVCAMCVLRLMNIHHDRGACRAEDHWDHPTALSDTSRADIERALRSMPKYMKTRVDAEKWLAIHKPMASV
jgi:hypothetical protein